MLFIVGIILYAIGYAIGVVVGNFLYQNSFVAQLTGLSLGGLLGFAGVAMAWYTSTPPAFRRLLQAVRTGFLIIAVGADKKLRLLPGYSDGFTIRPAIKPYREKYRWAADGESAYPIHGGKGTQAIITYMGYSFPLEVEKAAAISRFRDRGFKNLEELKTAVELPDPERVEERIRELEAFTARIEEMDDEEVQEKLGRTKEEALAEIGAEIERLKAIRDLIKEHGEKALEVNVDGAVVRASDLINYLLWRHHPAELERIIKAETNAVLSRMNFMDWVKQLTPVIIISAIAVIGVLTAIYLLRGGGASTVAPILHNASQAVHNITNTTVRTITIAPSGG